MARLVPLLVCLFVASVLATSVGVAQRRTSTERLTLVVEILERDDTPVIPCGILGAQPRDVTARVIRVEEGAFDGDRILLRWPVCTVGALQVGARFRVQIRRFVDRPIDATTRYRVRRSWADPGS